MKKTYRWIYRNCGKELLWVILLGASSILMAGAFLGLAVAASYLLDVIIGSKEGHPYLWGGVVLGIILLLALLNILNTNIRARAGGRIEMRLRRNLFDQLLKKRYPQLKQIHSGEIINRMTSDVEILVNTLITLVPSALSMATKLGAGLALLFLMEWRFTLLILAAGVGVGLANRLFGKRFRHLHKEIQRTNGVVRSFLQECMENVIAIKSFSNESAIESKLDDYQQANYKIRLKRVRVLNLANTSVYVIFTVGYYAAMVWGGIGIARGVFTFGALTAFLQIINQVKAPFRNISGLIPQYFSMTPSAERLMELEELTDEKKETEIPDVDEFYEGLEAIEGEGLSFRYQDDEEDVLENTDFSIPKGKLTVIFGKSGIGKSSLVKLLLSIESPTQGSLFLQTGQGRVPIDAGTRHLFAYVPQGNLIFSGTIRENLLFGRADAPEEEIRQAAQAACVWEDICAMPQGLDTPLGERGSGMSEGQIQRLAIARAILSRAPILLLDECTSALDIRTERLVLQNIRNLRTKTIICISHRNAVLEYCDLSMQICRKKLTNAL